MLCDVCKNGLEGIWNPASSKRLGSSYEFAKNFYVDGARIVYKGWQSSSSDETEHHELERHIYGHHVDTASFYRSIEEGCAMCNRFRLIGFESGLATNEKIERLGYSSVFSVKMQEGKIIMTVYHEDISGGFYLVPVGDPKYDSNLNFELGPHTDGPETRAMVQKWFTTCIETHDGCRKRGNSSYYMPSRILEVDHSKSAKTFRLVEGSACPPHSQYVTMSHSWGSDPNDETLRLSRSTMNKIRSEQLVSSLPKTFVDGIRVAGHFGIRYIWIDRLCILQDSTEDWRREASSMQEVYRNSLLNISALGAEDDNGGCFFARDPSKVAPAIVRIKLELLSFEEEPLVQRAWVVQEQLLASRTVYFGRAQVFWECEEANRCETHPDGVGFFDRDEDEENGRLLWEQCRGRNEHLGKQLLDAPDQRHAADAYEQLFLDWNAIVMLYGSCKLSVASDKLVALSGLANEMKRRLQEVRPGNHRYLAGLWEEKLLEHIAWSVASPVRRAARYRAPSWSWACLDGHLFIPPYGSPEALPCASLISVETQPLDEDDTGELKSGSLTLTCPYVIVRLAATRPLHSYTSEIMISSFHHPHNESHIRHQDDRHKGTKEDRLSSPSIKFDTLDDICSEFFSLIIRAEHLGGGLWCISGLAIALTKDNTCRRIGLVTCYFRGKDKAQEFLEMLPREQVTIM